jgi:D-aminopeptidase
MSSSGKTIRLRDLGVNPGTYPTGPNNAITDVPGVLVGQTTLIQDSPHIARTGVTAIFPRPDIRLDHVFAAYHSFNGIGEMTGLPILDETGLLFSPVVLTTTKQVGMAYDAVVRYGARKFGGAAYWLPVVAETYDGFLNDADAFPLTAEHVIAALEAAHDGPVPEGNCGGGTGMICYEFKGGTGTASRQVGVLDTTYTVGALVQANFGWREHLRVDGAPVGREISPVEIPSPWSKPKPSPSSSVIAVIATDAPLLPNGCRALAQRATVGVARTGGFGLHLSGDIFLAFSTGNHYDPQAVGLNLFQAVPHSEIDPLIIAAAEVVEEAILNALVAARTMTGRNGLTAHALPHDRLVEIVRNWGGEERQ